jgi:hypothetical protein
MRLLLLALSVSLVAGGGLGAGLAGVVPPERTVVLLVFDGFAPSLIARFPTPALDRMRREGSFTHHLVPPFPTLSLPSGITLSTGCWPEHHGIVHNFFLDPERGTYLAESDSDWLTGCEHLHEAAERQGVRSAVVGWYGGRSAARGALASTVVDRPARCASGPDPGDWTRAVEVERLLALPDAERPRLVVAYFCGPDRAEHDHGMESGAARAAVVQSDAIAARILSAVDVLPHRDEVAVLVTTDHGMSEVRTLVNVPRILRRHGIGARAILGGSVAFLYFDDPAAIEPAALALAGYPELEVLRKDAQPAWARLGTGPRVGDLILVAKPPYFIEDVALWPRFSRWLADFGPEFLPAGFAIEAAHGFPPQTPGMHGIFYAVGARIARGRELPELRAVDLHPTLALLLGIRPGRDVDGEVVERLLSNVTETELSPATGFSQ